VEEARIDMATPRTTAHTLSDLARQFAPHLRIISASQPGPVLRTYNVIALADSAERGREAVLALEAVEHDDEQLGTVVMGATGSDSSPHRPSADREGVAREIGPRILVGGVLGAIVGAIVIGAGAFLLGARGWEVAGAAAAGAMLVSVFGVIWVTFAGMGGSDAYRQTFVEDDSTHLTLVSVHTDDPDEAAAAHDRLRKSKVLVIDVDRYGQVASVP
jgi:hypothetical protein